MSRVVDVEKEIAPVRDQIGDTGFLHNYVRWAVTQTDAPTQFHIPVALALLSTTANFHVRVGFGRRKISPNLYVMIVGESGRERKSSAMGLGQMILDKAAPERVGARFGSYESLVDQIVEKPTHIVFESEFSRFLSQASGKGSYIQAVKTGLTDVYDGVDASVRTRGRGVVNTGKNYRLSLVAGISDTYLAQFTEPTDFTGGFLSRWLFSMADRTRLLYMPLNSPEIEAQESRLVDHLSVINTQSPGGRYRLSREADEQFCELVTKMDRYSAEAEFKARGMYERAPMLILKISALLAVDRLTMSGVRTSDISSEDGCTTLTDYDKVVHEIQPHELTQAWNIVSAHLTSFLHIVQKVAHDDSARLKGRVLAVLSRQRTIGDITRITGLLKRQVTEVLGTLVAEELVYEIMGSGRTDRVFYVRAEPNEVLHVDGVPVGPSAPVVSEPESNPMGLMGSPAPQGTPSSLSLPPALAVVGASTGSSTLNRGTDTSASSNPWVPQLPDEIPPVDLSTLPTFDYRWDDD